MTGKKEYSQSVVLVLLFAAIGFIVYLPVLGNTFLADDYDSLYRIYIEKRIIYREFLRPMIDISFYFNYLISGFSAWSFYVFNVIVHVINALLLLRFTRSISLFGEKDQFLFGLIAAFLFLVYPFHNESISWLSGRLSSMACLFALLSLILSQKDSALCIFFSITTYILGLLCYESIIILPVIIFIIKYYRNGTVKKAVAESLYLAGTACVYLIVRILLSGTITGNYAKRIIDEHAPTKILNIAKVLWRLFLPPAENHFVLIPLIIACFGFLAALHFYLFRKNIFSGIAKKNYLCTVICLAVSLLIPFAFGVSTHTSEGDRLLYFPSCFLCILIAGWIIALIKNTRSRIGILLLIGTYFICFLELNNMQWVKASGAAKSIMNAIENRGPDNVVLINIPDELEGAFIFRNGFKKALMIKHIDTAQVKLMNYLYRPDYLRISGAIEPSVHDSVITIFPFTQISLRNPGQLYIYNELNKESITVEKERNLIYYWTKEKLVKLF